MSLFTITIIATIVLIAKGLLWFICPQWVDKTWRLILRSQIAATIVVAIAGIWFLWIVAHLGEADFGQYRNWLMVIFGAIIIGSLFFLKDFLFVRGVAVLKLLIANFVLGIAYMQPPTGRLFLVALVYLMIIEALYFGALPYKLRDLLIWIFASKFRVNTFAAAFTLYGLVLMGAAFTY